MPKDANGVIWPGDAGLLMWPQPFTPTVAKGASPGTEPKYSCMLVMSGNEPHYQQFVQELKEAMDAVSNQKFGATVMEMKSRGKFSIPVKSNSDPDAGKLEKAGFKERPNGIHFSASTKFLVPVMDAQRMGMSKDREAEIYSGCMGQIGVTCWGWDHPTGGKGLSFNLNGLWKQFDGTRLGGVQADMASLPDSTYVPEGAIVAPGPDGTPGGGEDQPTPPPQNGGAPAGGGGNFGF